MILTNQQVVYFEKIFSANHYERLPFVVRKAKGVFLYDEKGTAYLDLLAAYSAANQGHHHPEIVDALKRALDESRCGVVSNVVSNEYLSLFVSKIATLLPQLGIKFGKNKNKVLLKNGGVESVETAVKLMRDWGHKTRGIPDGEQEIIVFLNNFHGRTSTIVSASSTTKYKTGFRADSHKNGFVFANFGDFQSVEKAITKNTCGILVEPMQGEGGMNIPPFNFLPKLRKLADKHDLLLIFDEIQVGLGRTGKMFAFEHSGVVPDGIILGKALSGGLIPVSAFAANSYLMDATFYPGRDGSTYGGYPGACAVGLAALNVLVNENLTENARKRGASLKQKLQEIANKSSLVKEVRGKGLFIGVELKNNNAWQVCQELLKYRVIANDSHGHTIRISPPLIINEWHETLIVESLRKVLVKP